MKNYHILGIALAVGVMIGCAVPAHAATLKTQFFNSRNERVCVYVSHFKEVYVNVGFNGRCSFNIPDSEIVSDEK